MIFDMAPTTNSRTVWSYPKSGHWWNDVVPTMTNRQFKESFRIDRDTFSQLVDRVGPYLQKQDTLFRSAISTVKRIGCALYLLGTTSELRTVAHLFGIGKSTAAKILHTFCETMIDLFFSRLIEFPTTADEIKNTIQSFHENHQYPMCIGAIDGTHIAVERPLGEETDYFNYKKHHSVLMLAVVDASSLFTYVNVGAPGRCNDAFVYNRSSLYDVVQDPIFEQTYITVNNRTIQAHLTTDSAFALNKHLMKPYAERPNMPRDQIRFNYRLSRCRSTVERVFGHIKCRFRSIHKKMEYDIEHIKSMIKTVCILHNMCVDIKDDIETEWDAVEPIHKKPACNIQTMRAVATREALTSYFIQNPL